MTRIRKPDKSTPRHIKILVSIGIAMAGFALGVLQKWLDSGAVNELPVILQRIDIGNYFGRFAIWILLGTAMSALSGIKDSVADTMAVSFEQMNPPLAILCALGGIALLIGVVAAFSKKEKINNS